MTQIHCRYWTLLVAQGFPVVTDAVEGHSRNLCNLRIFNLLYFCIACGSIQSALIRGSRFLLAGSTLLNRGIPGCHGAASGEVERLAGDTIPGLDG
jgi:hypothetical protein